MNEAMIHRVRGMVARGVLRLVKDSLKLQGVQIELLDGEAHDEVERFQNYGLSGVPLDGAEGVVVCVGGLRSHCIVIAADDRRHRPTDLQPGEVTLYDDQGQRVHIRRDGIHIVSAQKVTVEAPQVDVISDSVNLGGAGGSAVARVGDPVSGGVIQAGSSKVNAA